MKKIYIQELIALALIEDVGRGDVTTDALISKDRQIKAHIIFKTRGIVCGLPVAREVFKFLDPKIKIKHLFADGAFLSGKTPIAVLEGSARAILTAERTALNFLGRLSGIATLTHSFVRKIQPFKTHILDTRKTTPLLRVLERYAVRTGGGENHRFNLNAMAMIKDNHRELCDTAMDISKMVSLVQKKGVKVEVEVDTLQQLKQALLSKADIILLDNMSVEMVRQAIRLRNQMKPNVLLEVSGGITLVNVSQFAATGVERISVGGLTHSAPSVDVSLEII